jgi:hypothetical protein
MHSRFAIIVRLYWSSYTCSALENRINFTYMEIVITLCTFVHLISRAIDDECYMPNPGIYQPFTSAILGSEEICYCDNAVRYYNSGFNILTRLVSGNFVNLV